MNYVNTFIAVAVTTFSRYAFQKLAMPGTCEWVEPPATAGEAVHVGVLLLDQKI